MCQIFSRLRIFFTERRHVSVPTVARGEHKIQTKLRIRIGDGDLLTQMILLIPFLIGTVSDGLHPLCIKVITLQHQYTRVQPPIRRKQHLRIRTDLLGTACRKALRRSIRLNWDRVELRGSGRAEEK